LTACGHCGTQPLCSRDKQKIYGQINKSVTKTKKIWMGNKSGRTNQ
jgi:hypothetical protein